MTDCTTCEGSGLYLKSTWDNPEIKCEDCNGTGDFVIQECLALVLEVDQLIGKSQPDLAARVTEALENVIKERS